MFFFICMSKREIIVFIVIFYYFSFYIFHFLFFLYFCKAKTDEARPMKERQNSLIILKSTLGRLPSYYCEIENRVARGEEYVSATSIAESLGINPVQVRKDLASISSEPGRPKLGFRVDMLLEDMKKYLGYDHYDEAVLNALPAVAETDLVRHVRLERPLEMYIDGFANKALVKL